MKENTKMKVYLDYAAATPLDPEVLRIMHDAEEKYFAHPRAIHTLGRAAKEAIEGARKRIARILEVRSEEVHFTRGGTDGNTKGVLGVVGALEEKGIAHERMHIIMSAIEHSSIRSCTEMLARRGVSVSIVPASKDGVVDPQEIKKLLRPTTILISCMLVNNEIGTVAPIRDIARMLTQVYEEEKTITGEHFSRPVLHTDASQAFSTLTTTPKSILADMMTLDAHKVYGPKGAGVLYVKQGTPFTPPCSIPGKEIYDGTPHTAGILGCVESFSRANGARAEFTKHTNELYVYFVSRLRERFPDVHIYGENVPHVGNICAVSFDKNEDGEFLVTRLDAEGVATSSKSACLSATSEGSHVIAAIDPDRAGSVIRFSFGRETTEDDLDYAVSVLVDILL